MEKNFMVYKSEAYEHRESVRMMLALHICQEEVDQAIEVIAGSDGMRATTLEDIKKVFEEYYTKLYMKDMQHSKEQMDEFLQTWELGVLDDRKRIFLRWVLQWRR
ncbi:hypothetical protein NDU88_001191 [Pleurodeles waltl]|uniref:Uncharacterized protein n=1 Tax=Pleurodeles waltl TaxID=8319 RepID=A0AAV7L928_PLEWA|nr:hypothetical protein NDU88_001191 [Pleurodeles waltl]